MCIVKNCLSSVAGGNTTNLISHLKSKHWILFESLKALKEDDIEGLNSYTNSSTSTEVRQQVSTKSQSIPELLQRNAQLNGEYR